MNLITNRFVALLSLVFLTLFLCCNISTAQTNTDPPSDTAASEVEETEIPAGTDQEPQKEKTNKSNWNSATHNLPIENRMADAADKANKLACIQNWIAFVGLALVVLTAWFAWGAWKAGKRTVEIGEAQVRAYLSAKTTVVSNNGMNDGLSFSVDTFNHGQSPAFKAVAYVEIRLFFKDISTVYRIFHELGTINVGINKGVKIGYHNVDISREKFAASAACHVKYLIKAKDVFKDEIKCTGYHTHGAGSKSGDRYTLFPKFDYSEIPGQEIKESDFDDLIPDWRTDLKI